MATENDEADLFHFIMRLPTNVSEKLQSDIDTAAPLEDKFFIQFDENRRQAEIVYDNELLHGRIMDLPCVVEILKTLDNKTFYKSGDIGQIMMCSSNKSQLPTEVKYRMHALNQENLEKQHQWQRGLTPPLKNVRSRRFRKTLRKKTMDWLEVEREVKKLIRDDLLAEKVEWELLYTEEEVVAALGEGGSKGNAGILGALGVGEGNVGSGGGAVARERPLTNTSSQNKLSQLFGEMSDSEDEHEDDEEDEDNNEDMDEHHEERDADSSRDASNLQWPPSGRPPLL